MATIIRFKTEQEKAAYVRTLHFIGDGYPTNGHIAVHVPSIKPAKSRTWSIGTMSISDEMGGEFGK